MLKERARLIIAANLVLDLALLSASFFAAYLLRDAFSGPSLRRLPPFAAFREAFLLFLGAWTIALWTTGTYASARVRSIGWLVAQSTKTAILAGLLCFAMLATVQAQPSRVLVGLALALGATSLTAERVCVRLAVAWARSRGRNYRQVVIVGTGGHARRVARTLETHPAWGLRIVGFVTEREEDRRSRVGGRPVVARPSGFAAYLTENVVDEVIFCVQRHRLARLEDVFLRCEELGICTRVMMNFLPYSISKVALQELDGIPMLTFSTTPNAELALLAKRVLDVVASACALALLSPVLAAVALAIRLEGPGPVLFRQRRVGIYGRPFTLLKFRSMVQGAEARQAEVVHLNKMDGPVFKIPMDPRVTRIGRLLRRLSLDELPQLVNVLRGEMSLVGPRPPLAQEVRRYQSWQRRRLSVKPGITCLWQVSGRNHIGFQKWMRLDLEYIDNWSLWLDLKILARTVPVVLGAKGAW